MKMHVGPIPLGLFLLLLVLKLAGVISWSWWWVTSPLWISLILGIGLTAFCFAYIESWRRKR